MSEVCCSLVCPPGVEEKLLDTLVMAFSDRVFASTPTFAHGVAHGAMSSAELVLGRARCSLVQILLRAQEWTTLKTLLTREFAGTGVRFWVTPVLEEGVCA